MGSEKYFIGVDVGTGSARAALVREDGEILAESSYETTTWRDDHNHDIFEQSTEEIWDRISKACKDILRDSKVPPEQVKGIGFDATCSLAVCDTNGSAVSVTPDSWDTPKSSDWTRNIVLWADHRAQKEAALINSTNSPVLQYVGGTISLEMEVPKILWLKNHMPSQLFKKLMFWDLADWMTYKATDGNKARSVCSLGCKCSFVAHGNDETKPGWNDEFFRKIGLEEFRETSYFPMGGSLSPKGSDLPALVLTAGQPVGTGLGAAAAKELGLLPGTPVGSGLIDAYAGWMGTVAAPMEEDEKKGKVVTLDDSKHRLAPVAGTSTCHVVQSPNSVFVKGVWGPYYNAVFPGYWMNEGGQSSTGQLLDFMLTTHPAYSRLVDAAAEKQTNQYQLLDEILDKIAAERKCNFLSELTKGYYVYPDLHGNRSPLADSEMRGMIIGLSLDKGLADIAIRYFATCEAIALQTRQIVEAMNKSGHDITSLFMSGGLVKSRLLMRLLANVCEIPVQLPFSSSASVVLGAAMLGAIAGDENEVKLGEIKTQKQAEERGWQGRDRAWDIMKQMSRPGTTVYPNASEREAKLLRVKYGIFLECIDLQRKWRGQVENALR